MPTPPRQGSIQDHVLQVFLDNRSEALDLNEVCEKINFTRKVKVRYFQVQNAVGALRLRGYKVVEQGRKYLLTDTVCQVTA